MELDSNSSYQWEYWHVVEDERAFWLSWDQSYSKLNESLWMQSKQHTRRLPVTGKKIIDSMIDFRVHHRGICEEGHKEAQFTFETKQRQGRVTHVTLLIPASCFHFDRISVHSFANTMVKRLQTDDNDNDNDEEDRTPRKRNRPPASGE